MSLIGVFDSGVGGLTVLREMIQRLPEVDFLYLGDTARLPYGSKSPDTVRRYALNAATYLNRYEIDLMVVACNTASASALPELSALMPVPVLGVVEPGAQAAFRSGARRIGIIGTEGTIRSSAYQDALHRSSVHLSIRAQACPLFVPLAEEGWGDHDITRQVARIYLRPLLEWGAEALILGCTHYPLLRPSIAAVAGPSVKLVDSATALCDAVIEGHPGFLAHPGGSGKLRLHLTDASERFVTMTSTILGETPDEFRVVDLAALANRRNSSHTRA